MGVRRRLLRELLASLKYIKNLTEKQITASLWRGQATLYDLVLEPRQLQQLFYDAFPVGLEILEATVKEVTIRIPWRQIMTQSIVVVAHNIEVRAVAHCDDDASWREVVATLQRNFLRNQLERVENAPHSLLSGPTGAFDQMRQRITDGLQIQVSSASLSLLSCHPRHFPSHSPPEGSTCPLAETFRIVGEDITVSPCDLQQMPTDKLKAMAVYVSDERVLKILKFMKCRSLRVSPGRSPNICPYAATEFMESPVVLTCHVCQRYPSDGTRICPFLLGNELSWEFSSLLGVTACECQVRAVMAVVNDVARLEEWRTNKDLIADIPTDTKADANVGMVGGIEQSLEGEFISNESDIDREDFSHDLDDDLANAGFGGDDLLDLDDEDDDMCSCASEGSPIRSRRLGTISTEGDCDKPYKTNSDPCIASPSMIGAECDESFPIPSVLEGQNFENLTNTSGVSRTLALGSESKRKNEDKNHLRKRFEGLSSAVDLFGFSRDNTASSVSAAPPAPELDGEPLMNTSAVARTFARGPEQRRAQLAEKLSHASAHSSDTLTWKKIWSKRKADLKALGNSFRPSREASNCQTIAKDTIDSFSSVDMADESRGQETEEMEVCDEGHESANEEDDEEVFGDAEDYFSVASSEKDRGGAARSRWLKPIARLLGSAKAVFSDVGAWPAMKQRKMVVRVCSARTILRITAVESLDAATPAGGFVELCIDNLAWRSEVCLGLPPPHLDCIHRLAHLADDRGIVAQVAPKNIPAVGAWCLPVLQQSSQAMQWPVALLKFKGFDACDTFVDLLYSGAGIDQLGAKDMLRFNWQPRDSPPLLVGSSPWVLRGWPIQICLHRTSFLADAAAWNNVKASWERCKPFFSSKNPAPSLLPPLELPDSDQLFPVECIFVDFNDCEVIEANQDRVILQEKRWPMHVTLPKVKLRSNSNMWDFSQVLMTLKTRGKSDQESIDAAGTALTASVSEESDRDVTIPKAMFDQLVKRSAEATLQHSQVKAAREELQKAYIMLAAARSGGQGSSSASHSNEHRAFASLGNLISSHAGEHRGAHGDAERAQVTSIAEQCSTTDSGELERLRRKCAQLESSLQSQELAQRRLEAEFSCYQTLARDELRQVLSSCTQSMISSPANAFSASASPSSICENAGVQGRQADVRIATSTPSTL